MKTVTSADETTIAYEREGRGPPLVLVHGGSGTRRSWDALRPHLVDDFTVVVPDRRGRGDSGDANAYALEREAADLRAVVDAVDGEPMLFGHSFGGLVALEAARGASLERLILYEPSILTGDRRRDADLAARMDARLEDGDRREAFELFFREAGGVADPKALPFWPDEVNFHLAETVIRENRAIESYRLADDLPHSVSTLLLTGEHGPEHLRDAVHDALEDSRLVELEGVGHSGISSAPERVASEVRRFVHGDYR